jgi:hypothetical protein
MTKSQHRESAFIAIIATVLGLMLQYLVSSAPNHNWTTLLNVGKQSASLELFKRDFLNLKPVDSIGHDAQFFYIIAKDPFLSQPETKQILQATGELPQYRFRRILYPILAGLGGNLSPNATLVGLIALSVLGLALATWALAGILALYGKDPAYSLIFMFINPCIWTNIGNLTCDNLSFGLGTAALFYYLKEFSGSTNLSKRKGAILCLLICSAILTRETYCLLALSLGLLSFLRGHLRLAFLIWVLPISLLVLWGALIAIQTGETFSSIFISANTLTFPLVGLIDAASTWRNVDINNQLLTFTTLIMIVAAIIGVARTRQLNDLIIITPWICLALCAASSIWVLGNNSVRVFCFFTTLLAMLYAKKAPVSTRISIRVD